MFDGNEDNEEKFAPASLLIVKPSNQKASQTF